MAEPRIVPIDEATLRRVEASLAVGQPPRSAVGRAWDWATSWMGPGRPVAILIPTEAQNPRGWDYRPGINLQTQPRAEATITHAELQALSKDTTTRMAIETCKNRLERCGWEIRPRDPGQKLDPQNKRLQEIRDRVRRPDGRRSWQAWLRSILDDRYVLDAANAFIRRNKAGGAFAWEQLEGATIRPLFDVTGRPPLEGPAYRQIIHGVSYCDLPARDFVYAMRNPRAHSPFGFSEVEQLVLTINIAIRRELAQLDALTPGTEPDALYAVDKEYGSSPEAIVKIQDRWDSLFNTHGRVGSGRRLRFVPPGELKELLGKPYEADFDELLGRKISYNFNLPPTWIAKMVNRATSEQTEESSLNEGMQPDMLWVKQLVDDLIERTWDAEFEFAWHEVRQPNPEVQQRIFCGYAAAGIMGRDEIRDKIGLPRIGVGVMVDTPMGPVEIGTLDPDTGKPRQKPEGEDGAADPAGTGAPTAGAVQDTALNGAQISSLLEVTQKVSEGALTEDGGVAVILVSFPTIDEAEAKRIVAGAKPVEKPDPTLPPPGTPPGAPNPKDPPPVDDEDDDPPPPGGKKAPPVARARTVAGVGAKQKKLLAGAKRNGKVAKAEGKLLAGVLLAALVATREAIATQVTPHLVVTAMRDGGALTRRDAPPATASTVLADLDMGPIEAARAAVAARLAAAAGDGAEQGVKTVQVLVPAADAFAVDSAVVSAWAQQRAAELVGKRVIEDGTVIDNPNPRYAITESTRAMVRETIVKAFDEGWSRATLEDELERSYAFSEQRATLIARTEVSRAMIAGNVLGWQASGVVAGKEWLLGSEHDGEDECDLNAAAGVIAVTDAFPSGDMEPPAHPGCVCDVAPVVSEDDVAAAETVEEE